LRIGLLLLYLLLAYLLQLLEHLLRRLYLAGLACWRRLLILLWRWLGRIWLRPWRLRILLIGRRIIVIVAGVLTDSRHLTTTTVALPRGSSSAATGSQSQHQLAWCAIVENSHHHDVVAHAIQ
jgi:hypothetical protein